MRVLKVRGLAQSTPSIVYHILIAPKRQRYAGLPSNNDSCLNDIWLLQRVRGIICFEDLLGTWNVQRTGIRVCRKNGVRLHFLYPLLRQRRRNQHHDFMNCSLGLMICDKMEEPWIINLLPDCRGLGLLTRQKGKHSLQHSSWYRRQ